MNADSAVLLKGFLSYIWEFFSLPFPCTRFTIGEILLAAAAMSVSVIAYRIIFGPRYR